MTNEEIENEIGISLSKVYEAATKGFWFLEFCGLDESKTAILKFRFVNTKESIFPIRVDFHRKEIVVPEYVMKFDGYGKIWALTKEELE